MKQLEKPVKWCIHILIMWYLGEIKSIADRQQALLNHTASLQQLAALLTPLFSSNVLFCDPKNSDKIRLWPNFDSK